MNQMTFKEEDGYIVCYINGKEVSRAKKSSAGASTQDVIDIINDQIKANPDLSGTEPDLTGVEFSGDKYAVPQGGGSSLLSDIVDANGNPRFVEGDITTGTFSGVTFTYAKWSLSGTHLMLVVSMDLESMASFTTIGTVLAYVELPEYIYNKIFGTVLDWKNSNVFSSQQMVNNIQVYLKKQNNRIEFVTAANYGGGTAGTDRIQFDLLIDSE